MKKKLLSVLLVLCMVLTLMPMAALADFSDTEGHWGKNAIDRWTDVGVLNGKGDGIFDPNGSMTRAEFAQMLCNMMGYTKKANNIFSDVPDDAWYADAILKLVEAGVLNGTSATTASPNAPITREQAAVMLVRAFNIKTDSGSMSFSDSDDVSSWARSAVAALTDKGMMNGVGDNKVAPQLYINRASVATLIDNMVADYVTEDKTITGEVNGIIVVAGDAKVTIEDATVTAPIIVAPAAEGAEVALTGTTTAENVIAAAEGASVTVAKSAAAESVTASGDSTEVKVEGTVDAVAVEGEDAKVDVSGKVTTVTTEAPNTTVAVSGKVENVEIGEGADKTEVTTTSGARIEKVTTAADDVKVSGNGEVLNVTAEAGSAQVTTEGTQVENKGADSVTAGDKIVESGDTTTSNGGNPPAGAGTSSSGSSSDDSSSITKKNDAGLVAAPLVDHPSAGDDKAIPSAALGTVTVNSVKIKDADENGSGAEYSVVITGKDIMLHANKNGDSMYWVGVGIPVDGTSTYEYERASNAEITADDECNVDGKKYDTFYFGKADVAQFSLFNDFTLVQNVTIDEKLIKTTYKLSFNVTAWQPTSSVSVVIKPDATLLGKLATTYGEPFEHKFVGDILGLTDSTVSGTTINLSGTTSLDALKNTARENDETTINGYVTYALKISNPYIADLEEIKNATPPATYDTDDLGLTNKGVGVVVNTKIYDATAKQFVDDVTHTWTLLDKAGRTQGTVDVVVKTGNCKLEGSKTVKVEFNDGKTITTKSVVIAPDAVSDVEVTPPTLTNTDAGYYTGNWKLNGSKVALEADGKYKVSKDTANGTTIKLEAEIVPIYQNVTVATRGAGVAKGLAATAIEDFDYAAEYKTAGITLADNVVTADSDTVKAYITAGVNAAENSATKLNMQYLSNSTYLRYGIAFPKVQGATKVKFNYNGQADVNVFDAKTTYASLTGNWHETILATDDASSYNGQYVRYLPIATNPSSGFTAMWGSEDVQYVVVYANDAGEILAIQTATVSFVATELAS